MGTVVAKPEGSTPLSQKVYEPEPVLSSPPSSQYISLRSISLSKSRTRGFSDANTTDCHKTRSWASSIYLPFPQITSIRSSILSDGTVPLIPQPATGHDPEPVLSTSHPHNTLPDHPSVWKLNNANHISTTVHAAQRLPPTLYSQDLNSVR